MYCTCMLTRNMLSFVKSLRSMNVVCRSRKSASSDNTKWMLHLGFAAWILWWNPDIKSEKEREVLKRVKEHLRVQTPSK